MEDIGDRLIHFDVAAEFRSADRFYDTVRLVMAIQEKMLDPRLVQLIHETLKVRLAKNGHDRFVRIV